MEDSVDYYRIVRATTISELVEGVNSNALKGYEVSGGLVSDSSGFYQPMVYTCMESAPFPKIMETREE